MKNTCVSLNCPFIPFCNQYNYLVDRGDECEVQQKILERGERFMKDRKRREREARKKDGEKCGR